MRAPQRHAFWSAAEPAARVYRRRSKDIEARPRPATHLPCDPRGSVREGDRRLIGPGVLETHRAARQPIPDVGPGFGEPIPGREPGPFLVRIVPRAAADRSGNGRARGVRFHRVDTGMATEEYAGEQVRAWCGDLEQPGWRRSHGVHDIRRQWRRPDADIHHEPSL